MSDVIKVVVFECERGWGKKVDEIIEFSSLNKAETFVNEFNSKNDKPYVPDWYMYAEVIK